MCTLKWLSPPESCSDFTTSDNCCCSLMLGACFAPNSRTRQLPAACSALSCLLLCWQLLKWILSHYSRAFSPHALSWRSQERGLPEMKRRWHGVSRLLPPVLDCPPRMAGGLVPLPKASGGSRPVPPQQQQALESSSWPAQSVGEPESAPPREWRSPRESHRQSQWARDRHRARRDVILLLRRVKMFSRFCGEPWQAS